VGALTRHAILAAEDLTRERVKIPAWGGYVYVRTMTGRERDAFETAMIRQRADEDEDDAEEDGGDRNLENYRARLLTYCVVDDQGQPIFVAEEDAKALGEKSIAALQRLFNVATRLNAITEQDVKDLVGNSGAGPSGGSSSDSPSTSG
jgi:hypothetical protein